MGCGESRQQGGGMAKISNYHTLTTAFVSGDEYETSLAPIDQLEFLYKDSLPEAQGYGSWEQRIIDLDENLKLVEGNADILSYAETSQK